MLLSQEARASFDQARTTHNLGDLPEGFSLGTLSFAVINGTADEVIAKIDKLLEGFFFQMMGIKDMVTYVNDGGKVSIAFKFPSKIYQVVAPFIDIIKKLQDEIKVD